MRNLVILALVISGCVRPASQMERELSQWYQQQMMWEKFCSVQEGKQQKPGIKVEVSRSAYLEKLYREAVKAARRQEDPFMPRVILPTNAIIYADQIEDDDSILRQSSIRPVVDPNVVPHDKLELGRDYMYCPPIGNPIRVRLVYGKYRGTYGIVDQWKWRKVYFNHLGEELETADHPVFKYITSENSPREVIRW